MNIESDVAQARDEISIEVDPKEAAGIGLNTRQVGLQLSQYLIGRKVTSITIDGEVTDVVLAGDPQAVNGIDSVKGLTIAGPGGVRPLGELAEVTVLEGPVTISRTDGVRSVRITGDITAEDTQAVGMEVDGKMGSSRFRPACASSAEGSSRTSPRVSRPSSSPWGWASCSYTW